MVEIDLGRFLLLAAVLAVVLQTPTSAQEEDCTDVPPDEHPCSRQLAWGKCTKDWMMEGNYCAETCGFCGEGSKKPKVPRLENGVLEDGPTEVEESDTTAPPPKERRRRKTNPTELNGDSEDLPEVHSGVATEEEQDGVSDLVDGNGDVETVEVATPAQPVPAPFQGIKSSCRTIMDTIGKVPDLSTAKAILDGLKDIDEELLDLLKDEDSRITVFLPTNEAFEPYFEALGLSGGADPETIQKVLRNHIVDSVHHSRTLKTGKSLQTLLDKEKISVVLADPSEINLKSSGGSAEVTFANIWACKSIIHVLNDVLMPEGV